LEREAGARVGADVSRRFDLEPVRRQPLDADGGPCLRIARAEVLAHARDDVPPSREAVPPEGIDRCALEPSIVRLGLRPEPEAVDVAADPARVLQPGAARPRALPLELIEEHDIVP